MESLNFYILYKHIICIYCSEKIYNNNQKQRLSIPKNNKNQNLPLYVNGVESIHKIIFIIYIIIIIFIVTTSYGLVYKSNIVYKTVMSIKTLLFIFFRNVIHEYKN